MIGDPISERIVCNVVETLSAVRQSAGFFHDFIVERELQDGNSPRDNLVVVMVGDPKPSGSAPMGHSEWLLPIGIIFYAIESQTSATAIATRLQRGAADVRKALAADLHRGGLAANTELDVFPDNYNKSMSPYSVLITPQIRFRHLWNNPYKQY